MTDNLYVSRSYISVYYISECLLDMYSYSLREHDFRLGLLYTIFKHRNKIPLSILNLHVYMHVQFHTTVYFYMNAWTHTCTQKRHI